MALGKTFTSTNGVTTTYHRIQSITVNFFGTPSTSVRVVSYVSDAIRQAGDDRYVGDVVTYPLTGVVNTLAGVGGAYNQLKVQYPAVFGDAVDV